MPDDKWFEHGIIDRALSISIEIFPTQLLEIQKSMARINVDPRYRFQLLPRFRQGKYEFETFYFNCLIGLWRAGAGVNLPFGTPDTGDMQKFQKLARPLATPVKVLDCSQALIKAKYFSDGDPAWVPLASAFPL